MFIRIRKNLQSTALNSFSFKGILWITWMKNPRKCPRIAERSPTVLANTDGSLTIANDWPRMSKEMLKERRILAHTQRDKQRRKGSEFCGFASWVICNWTLGWDQYANRTSINASFAYSRRRSLISKCTPFSPSTNSCSFPITGRV